MKIDFTVALKDLEGLDINSIEQYVNPDFIDSVTTPKVEIRLCKSVPVTLRSACVTALLTEESKTVKAEEKLQRFNLANNIQLNDEVDLTAEDVVLLKKLVCKTVSIYIYGKVVEILESSI